MNQDKSLKYMVSMMNAWENMEMQMFGSIILTCLIYYLLPLLLKIKYFAFMEVFLQILRLLIKLDKLIGKWKFHMKDQCVISFGLTLMTGMVGEYLQEEQDLHLDKMYHKTLIGPII